MERLPRRPVVLPRTAKLEQACREKRDRLHRIRTEDDEVASWTGIEDSGPGDEGLWRIDDDESEVIDLDRI